MLGALAAALLCAAVAAKATRDSWRTTKLSLVCLGLGCALGMFQLIATAEKWNPTAAQLREQFTESLKDQPSQAPLSVYPPGTQRDLLHLIAATAAFALGAAFFYESKALLKLMLVLAAAGVAVACFGLAQRASSQPWQYAGINAPLNSSPFGPFIGRNNAGGFLNICFAAALGMFVWRLQEFSPRLGKNDYERFLPWIFQNLTPAFLSASLAVVCILAGILASLSRGAVVAAIAGGGTALLVTGISNGRQFFFWALGIGTAAALAIVIWIGQGDVVELRWARTLDVELFGEGRPRLWMESLEAVKTYGWFGAGLGAFYYGYAPFENHATLGLYRNAENQYVEALVAGGYVGCLLLLVFGATCLRAVSRLMRGADEPERIAVAAGGVSLLFSQAICACFDFGWYLPSIYVPLCLWAGGLVRRVSSLRHRRSRRRSTASRPDESVTSALEAQRSKSTPHATTAEIGANHTRHGILRSWAWFTAIAILLAVGIGWAFRQNHLTTVVQQSELATRPLFQNLDTPLTDDAVEATASLQRTALEAAPNDGELRVRYAEVLVEQFRRKSGKELLQVYAAAQLYERIGNDVALAALRSEPLVTQYLTPALQQARQARILCPFNFFAHRLVAQLCFIDESPSANAVYLQSAERLARGHASWLLEIGIMHLEAARFADAWRTLRQAWTMSPEFGGRITTLALTFLTPREMLKLVIPDDPTIINEVLRRELVGREFATDRRAYCEKMVQLLLKFRRRTAEREFLHGYALLELGTLRDAEEQISAALREPDADAKWYFDLAVVRAALGEFELADAAFARYRLLVDDRLSGKDYLRRAADLLSSQPTLDADGRCRCGAILLRIDAWPEALVEFRRAVELQPTSADGHAGMAQALLQLGRLSEAVREAAQAVQLAQNRNELRELLTRAQAAENAMGDGASKPTDKN